MYLFMQLQPFVFVASNLVYNLLLERKALFTS